MPREADRVRPLRRLKLDSVLKERPRANQGLCSTAEVKLRLNRDLRLARVRRKFRERSSKLGSNLMPECLVTERRFRLGMASRTTELRKPRQAPRNKSPLTVRRIASFLSKSGSFLDRTEALPPQRTWSTSTTSAEVCI